MHWDPKDAPLFWLRKILEDILEEIAAEERDLARKTDILLAAVPGRGTKAEPCPLSLAAIDGGW